MSENKLKDTLSIAKPFILEREDAEGKYRTDKGWKVYKDKLAEDKLTVGPGLTADTGYAELQKMKADETIPHETINSLFGNFLKTTDTQLKKEFPNIYPALNKNQQASLISLIYNTGMDTFKHPTKTNKTSFAYDALKEAGKHLDNAEMKNKFLDEFLEQAHGKTGFIKTTIDGKKQISEGLVNRRNFERKLFNKPVANGTSIFNQVNGKG